MDGWHARIQEFFVRGVQVSLTNKSSDVFFFFKSSAYFTEVKLQRNLSFFKVPEGVQHFPGGGGGGGGGGSNCLFPIETHITCDFPGGVRTPCPPSGSALGWIQTENLHIIPSFFLYFLPDTLSSIIG